ncbi:4-hydroxybutyrate dehydrogenase [Zongyangia hominis]|uniref:4-hydroxybutyrate dehydrogenase n=1 Tax=Zongyangia hominis TaxID=2763677 RepID=A0A926ICI4_9FIRM|nr:4-hydroxybutyrate dehydrogenase [Zongyangia hominis]MBC8571398.1 4-hydroxybutyrate dehydrogenase [Zongyangia hominis]
MKEIIFRPELYEFESCADFAREFQLGEGDLILTNAFLFEDYFKGLDLPVSTLFQERYGAGEPTDLMVDAILEDAAKTGCKRIIAVGGGTIIDIAKVMAVSSGETVDDLYAKAAALQKKRGLVIVPTTCGTGSEMTNISIINRTRIGTKMGLVSEAMFADQAVLIPALLTGLPFPVFATSSIDALVHAVESSLSPKATPYTRLFGYKAIEMILRGYQRLTKEGPDALVPLLRDFLIASNYAGLAFGTAGCAAVHALSYPLGGKYHVPHGESNYAMFTGVLKAYQSIRRDGALQELNAYLSKLLGCEEAKVYDALETLLNHILPKKPLHAYGVTEADLPEFARSVMETQGRLMGNNFVPLDEAQVLHIYQSLY